MYKHFRSQLANKYKCNTIKNSSEYHLVILLSILYSLQIQYMYPNIENDWK